MSGKQPAVYIMATGKRGTLYIGVTGSLRHRVFQHREGLADGFTRTYAIKHLVWFEFHEDFPSAIKRETQLKRWNRNWKLELIEQSNPAWNDLWPEIDD